MSSQKSGLSSSQLKWIVIGVLGIFFMLMFREQIANLLDNSQEVKIGQEGISVVTKTVDTPFGETIVSGPPTPETAGITPQALPDYQSPKGYLINWPQDGLWVSMPDFAQTLGVDYAVVYAPAIGKQFAPNVTVITQPSQGMSIQQIMQSLQNDVSEMDLQVVDVQIDDVNKSGVITVSGNLWGVQIDGVQRIILHQGYAYIATAMLPIALRGDTAVTQGINQILNSFRV
jgi:hypothetical protein